jgi:polar amino acid transport system substrate-binding protein
MSFTALTRQWATALAVLSGVVALPGAAHAQAALRYGLFESMGYPLNTRDTQGRVNGGLLSEMGELLAKELGRHVQTVPLSRRRIEPSLLRGDVDLVCYHSPGWTAQQAQFGWTIATLPQIERIVVRKGAPMPEDLPQDLLGKRISTQHGYGYPTLQPLFDAGKATRVDDSKVAFQFKSVALGATDLLVTSETEIEGFFNDHPEERGQFETSKAIFTAVPTQCAVSPKSRVSVAEINRALGHLMHNGALERLARKYRLSMR